MRSRALHLFAVCCGLLTTTWSSPAAGEEGDVDGSQGLTLPELEERALAHYPEIEAAEAEVDRLEAALGEVRWQPLSGVRVQGTLSPTPERRGDAVHYAQGDLVYIDIPWGVLVRTQLDVSIPIYTFGRLGAERDAARADIDEGREKVRAKRRWVIAQVRRAYDALQLSKQSTSLLEEGRGYIERAQRYIDRSLDEDTGDITEGDRLQVEVLSAEVEARLADARRGSRLATAALRMLAGLEGDEGDSGIATPTLEPIEIELGPLRRHLDMALESRPEVAAAAARTTAAQAGRRAARARFFPEIRFVGDIDYAYSNVGDDQLSPFAYDPFNHFRIEFGLALRWDLDFMSDRARFHQAVATLREAEAEEEVVTSRVSLEVEEAYIEVEENQNIVAARRRGRRASRGWLISIMQGIDVGVLEPPELVDALRAYFEQSFLYLEAVVHLNASIGQLDLAVGAEGDRGAAAAEGGGDE